MYREYCVKDSVGHFLYTPDTGQSRKVDRQLHDPIEFKCHQAYSPGARRSIFPLISRLSIIKAGGQRTVKTSHIAIISRLNSTHSLVKVLVPVVFILELTNAVLTGCQF